MQHYTKLVRQIMRKHGKSTIYTNKHKNTRTVKCYENIRGNRNMIHEIKTELGKLGIDFSIKKLHNSPYGNSIIVTVPMQQM